MLKLWKLLDTNQAKLLQFEIENSWYDMYNHFVVVSALGNNYVKKSELDAIRSIILQREWGQMKSKVMYNKDEILQAEKSIDEMIVSLNKLKHQCQKTIKWYEEK